jgi:hypothetical protein
MDEGARGATSAQIGAVAEEVPSRHLPPVTYEDLPDPLPLRKVLGPGVVSIGIGVRSGELIIWPFITSPRFPTEENNSSGSTREPEAA